MNCNDRACQVMQGFLDFAKDNPAFVDGLGDEAKADLVLAELRLIADHFDSFGGAL